MSDRFTAVIAKHVAACCAELRAAVEQEFAQAIAGLAPGTREKAPALPVARAKPPWRGKLAPVEREGRKSQPTRKGSAPSPAATSSPRTCGCGPVGRHRRECKREQPPRDVQRSPRVERAATTTDSPRVTVPVDETRAARFARIEASAAKRNGASA